MDKKSKFTLGPLPWHEDDLRRAYFQNFTNVQKAIQEHPGYIVHHDLYSLRMALDIFLDSVSDLFQSIDAFHADAGTPEFWLRPAQCRFKNRELAVRRGVFSVITSALALVGHSRKIKNRAKITDEEYKGKLKEIFDEDEHLFIQGLRNYAAHCHMIETDWQRSYSAAGKQTRFLLQHNILIQWDDWSKGAIDFINRHPTEIDIEDLFNSYRNRVRRFHGWFHSKGAQVSEPQLSEYREYKRMLKRFGKRASWNLILDQIMVKHLDPVKLLDRYLTKDKLNEILTLPQCSHEQIDRIIEILDDFGSCDDELRRKVYRSFNVISK